MNNSSIMRVSSNLGFIFRLKLSPYVLTISFSLLYPISTNPADMISNSGDTLRASSL